VFRLHFLLLHFAIAAVLTLDLTINVDDFQLLVVMTNMIFPVDDKERKTFIINPTGKDWIKTQLNRIYGFSKVFCSQEVVISVDKVS
jgi:hypothetical protein